MKKTGVQTNMILTMILLLLLRIDVAQCLQKRLSCGPSLVDLIINTDTTLKLEGQMDAGDKFQNGDQFEITFTSYYPEVVGYKSFNNPVLTIKHGPQATLSEITDHKVTITITADYDQLTYLYEISGFKTPYSQISNSNAKCKFSSGGVEANYQSTPRNQEYFEYELKASSSYKTPIIKITQSDAKIGGQGTVDITIPTPGVDFTSLNGTLVITLPRWFSDTSSEYVFQQGSSAAKTSCTSPNLVLGSQDLQSGSYTLTYIGFKDSFDPTSADLVLQCTNVRFPVYPQIMTGFSISLKDAYTIPRPICTYPSFSLDARTGMAIQTLLSTEITQNFFKKGVQTSANTIAIQEQCTIEFKFKMPMPNANGLCYLAIKFPSDMKLTSDTYIYQGYNVMMTSARQNFLRVDDANVFIQQQPYKSTDLTNSNLIVLKGCNFANANGLSTNDDVKIRITNIYTPDSVVTTGNFEIKIYKDFDYRNSASYPYFSFQNQLLEGTKSISSTKFESGTITNGEFFPTIYYIQTDNTFKIKFKIANDIPGYNQGVIHPKIVIIIPKIMTRSSNSINIKNLDGSFINSQYTYGDENSGESGSYINSGVGITCSSSEWTCFWIKTTKGSAIPGGTEMHWQISGATNQVSVQTAGNFYVQTSIAAAATSTTWSNIDFGSFASNFKSVEGSIQSMNEMTSSSKRTWDTDTTYKLNVMFNNYIPINGYIKIDIPSSIEVKAQPTGNVYISSATTNNLVSYYSHQQNFVKFKVKQQLEKGVYTIEWNKNRNPRTFLTTEIFNVTSYDSASNVVGFGQISTIRMIDMSQFGDFEITQTNKSNGVNNDYNIKFKTEVPLENGDTFEVLFPKNPKTIITQKKVTCVKGACMTSVSCKSQGSGVQATFQVSSSCTDGNKQFEFYIKNVSNAPTMLQSKAITATLKSKDYQGIAEYSGDKRISNEYPGLFNRTNLIIDQDSYDYGVTNDYHFRIIPTNPIPQNSWVEIKYPKQLQVNDKFKKKCSITTTQTFEEGSNCEHNKDERIVTFYNTFLYGDQYTSEIAIVLNFKNPDNNFPLDSKNLSPEQKKQAEIDAAFQITTITFDKSFSDLIERDAKTWAANLLKKKYVDLQKNEFKYVDYFPFNTVKPKLKCNYPCYTCLNNNPDFCLTCWGFAGPKIKRVVQNFLQPRTIQTCLSKCDIKFTTNGVKQVRQGVLGVNKVQLKTFEYYKCVDCDRTCKACEGQDKCETPDCRSQKKYLEYRKAKPNDRELRTKCKSCSFEFPYHVKKELKCYVSCVSGYYEKTIAVYPKQEGECVKCEQPCEQCRKCYKEKNKLDNKNKDDYCNLKALSGVNPAPHKDSDPSLFFCTKCYQTAFWPLHVDDIVSIEGYVSNQNGMVNNKLVHNFLDTKNQTIQKLSKKLENKFKEGGEVIDIDQFMKKKVGKLYTDGGLEEPNNGIQYGDKTYKELYLAQYNKFKFPLRGLSNNRCVAKCPSGTTNIAGFCQPCDVKGSHCEECRNSIKKCTKCIQTQPFRYLLGVTCRDVCPPGTVADPKQGRCLGCINGCKRCDVNDQKVCYECNDGLLLYIQKCVGTCPDGWRETFSGKKCIPEGEHTVIYFPLLILALLAGTISVGGKYSSKNISGQHKRLMSFYAFFGVIDVLGMWGQLLFTFIYGNMWMLLFPVIALGVNYYLNIQYKKLWDVIDPPKPQDEDKLVYEEILLINDCDQNFDNWNTKYFNVGLWVRRISIYFSHKFFQMPFTHFFGYLHLTMRTQDHYCMWQWEDKEAIRFKRGFISQDDLKNTYKPFQYKGKLVPKKIDNFDRDMLLQDKDYQFAGNVEGQQEGDMRVELEPNQAQANQIRDADKEGGSGSDRYEGGQLDYNIYDMEGGHRMQETINPFEYTQHYANYPRKDHEKVPDTRVFDLYKRQVKIDIGLIRPTLIIGNILVIAIGLAKRSANQLLIITIECIIISIAMICLQIYFLKNWEDHRLPFKMKDNKSNYLFKQKKSPKEQNKNLGKTEEEQLMPQWSKYMHLYKFNEIFLDNKLEEMLNIFGRRLCRSCIEFNTGTEKETDPRKVKSWPLTPTEEEEYRKNLDFDLIDFQLQNNVYAETAEPTEMFKSVAQLSTVGAQVFAFDVQEALNRKGGDLVTPGIDDDYHRRQGTKKKRGRKNKYYKQIDQEDDEEANQISDDSENDGLNLVKEEEEEDEDEELVRKRKAAEEQRKREEEEKRIISEEEARKAEELKQTKMAKEKRDKELKEEEERIAREQANRKAEDEKLKDEIVVNHSPNKMTDKSAALAQASESDKQSNFSAMQVQGNALGNFQQQQQNEILEVPPNADTRKFNECDIFGDYDRDEKGNVVVLDQNGKTGAVSGKDGQYLDKQGSVTNQRGYLVDKKTGDVLNNLNGEKMFNNSELDDRGEIPAPFNVEKHNFNPHRSRGDFDYDRNGKPIIKKNKSGEYVDKKGAKVSARGYRIDKDGHLIDNYGRKKFDKNHLTSDGDLPKLFNYNGRRFDITDVIGQLDKDANGEIMPLTDQNGQLRDKLGRKINTKGYLIDEFGNVVDKDGRQIFENKHLENDEIPKIFPWTKFNVKNVLGDFEMDPLGNPILEKDKNGNLIDRKGQSVNSRGYLIDKQGNVMNKQGKMMFKKKLLDSEDDIPKVFRTGLLKSDTASSLSRLMSEIERNQPSDFDQEEQEIQNEIAKGIKKKRPDSGQTSVDSMMEDTPANYNQQNQRFQDQEDDMDDGEGDDYGSQYDDKLGLAGTGPGKNELSKKKRKKKKKKRRKPQEMEDPNVREYMLAGAYGGEAKPKPKRSGIKYTTDLAGGMRDLTTPGMLKQASKANLEGSVVGGRASSSKGDRKRNRNRHGSRVSDVGSQIGSRVGSKVGKKFGDSTSNLLDPQQREAQLKQKQMDEIRKKQIAKAKKLKAQGKVGKISKDADFEKMFGKDIDEFLEDSEWDIESIDKMSQFSKNSKNTIRSASQASKLRGLEKVYLQRIETTMNQNSQVNPNATGMPKKEEMKKKKKFRDKDQDSVSQSRKKAWDTQSKASSKNQSISKVFQNK